MPSDIAHAGIVVGVDGSPSSTAAVRWAAAEATMRNSALCLVHAAPPPPVAHPVYRHAESSVLVVRRR